MYKTILYEVTNHIATVTLNRPEVGNAFSEDTYQEIIDVMREIDQNDDVKVAVLTGKGNHFCTGGDVKYFQHLIDEGTAISEENVLLTGEMVRSVKKNTKPIIAAINGVAAGAGLGLAMACDFIVMTESSYLVTAFIKMAFPGDTALIYTMQQALGTFRMKRHIMLGEPITAQMAIDYGLAYQVAAVDDLGNVTLELAYKLVASPTTAIGYQKALIAEMFYPEIDEFNKEEAKYMNLSSQSGDHEEAVDAFLNKRTPDF